MWKQAFWHYSNQLQILVDRVFNFYLFKHICLYLSHFFVVEKVLHIEIWEAFASSSGLCSVSHSPVLTSFPLPGLEWGSGWHLSITLGSGGRPLGSEAEAPWEAPIPRRFHRGPFPPDSKVCLQGCSVCALVGACATANLDLSHPGSPPPTQACQIPACSVPQLALQPSLPGALCPTEWTVPPRMQRAIVPSPLTFVLLCPGNHNLHADVEIHEYDNSNSFAWKFSCRGTLLSAWDNLSRRL